MHLTLSSYVLVSAGHSCKQQQLQPSKARRSSLQQHKPASRLSVQLLRWGRSTGQPARPRPRPRSCRAKWQSSRWLAGQKKPKGRSNKPKSERAGVLWVLKLVHKANWQGVQLNADGLGLLQVADG